MIPTALAGLLKRVGHFDPRKFEGSFDERLKLQKTIYLLQSAFRVNLGYTYNWYLRGPYSPGLAADAYKVPPVYEKSGIATFTDPQAEREFTRFIQFIGPHADDGDWMECAASLVY